MRKGRRCLPPPETTGAADCDEPASSTAPPITSATHGLQVDYPGSSAYVTSMGGSEFMGDGTAQNPSTGADQYWSGGERFERRDYLRPVLYSGDGVERYHI